MGTLGFIWASRTGVPLIRVQLRQKVCAAALLLRSVPELHHSHTAPLATSPLARTFGLQSSSLRLPGASMPKKEDGRPWTSRCLFTKAEKEETQLPMKWSASPRMYRSIWANSGRRLTTFT